jgi:hypothetical protein
VRANNGPNQLPATRPDDLQQLANPVWDLDAEELHRPHVTGHDHEPRVHLADQPGQGLSDRTGVLLPAVLGSLLEAALRPTTGCRSGDVQLLTFDPHLPVGAGGHDGEQLGTQPVHHHIGELALPPGQQRRNVGQHPAVGHIPRRGVR